MPDTTNFYDLLDIPTTATPEDVRRAYKKKALQNHPDRHASASPEEKQALAEKFRSVSNAYEVLKDPENRRLYDTHGVWPPPPPTPPRRDDRRPYARRPQPQHRDPFADSFFSEPFALFNRMFSDFRRPVHHPFHRGHDPFESMFRVQDMLMDLERDMFSAFPPRPPPMGFGFDSAPLSMPPNHRQGQQWASQSTMVRSINGVTHRIDKRRDWEGNEHVTHTYPDGREVYTLNGVEQQRSTQGYLPPPGPPPGSSRAPAAYVSPPPSYHSSQESINHLGRRHHRHTPAPVVPAEPIIDNSPRRWWRKNH
ncbi:hypothetical protein MKEN_00878800 [Mycena kentingensis (nom. inval.)]|nr:hypothetical protein MKEN_00878800 [Mycena kentingensis (nom. inval.)]